MAYINCICEKEKRTKYSMRKKYVKVSAVVEMSYIMPLFLLLFLFITYTIFYYHDKLVLNGAAAETAVLGAQLERRKETGDYDLEEIFKERIKGKLIYMTDVDITVQRDEDEITVSAAARKSVMKLDICQKAAIAEPEEKIRWLT